MDCPNNNTESRENKYFNFAERVTIELRFKDGLSHIRYQKN